MNVKSMCYRCYGQQFHDNNKYFLKDTKDDTAKISAQFMNLRKRYYGHSESTENNLVRHLFNKVHEKSNPESRIEFAQVYTTICKQPMLATGGDFRIVLGGDVYILYSCGGCSICPIRLKHWLRCSNQAGRNLPGSTVERGKWHCPANTCLKRVDVGGSWQ